MEFIRNVWDELESSAGNKVVAGVVVAAALFAALIFVADGAHAYRCDMGYDEPITCPMVLH